MQIVSAKPSAACPQAVSFPRPVRYPGVIQSPVWPALSTPRPASVQSVAAMNSTTSSPALSGIQCYGCSINIYQGPVNQQMNTQPVDQELSRQEFENFCNF